MNSAQYYEWISKFETRHTTDDCYTPPVVYDAVADYVAERYGEDATRFVRPFYPYGDYERFEYPAGCVVVDNPPFSHLSDICKFYRDNGIRFFLFAPALVAIRYAQYDATAVCVGVPIWYDNGANVSTSFVTNMEGKRAAMTSPQLAERVACAVEIYRNERTRRVPKYKYPDNVATSAMLNYMSQHGTNFSFDREDGVLIGALDAQKKNKKTIFGGGWLLSEKAAAEKAAAEKAAAEKAAAEVWELSEREKEIVRILSEEEKT